ncbi:unnamed protein product [Orchesella dallaii]|uniref:Uncharacterized protein n=1 Tax=Orchesella dallaii TaxID=48710 RepID=A0ABP1QKY3_9HEXA
MTSSSGSKPNPDRKTHSSPPIIFGTLNAMPQPNYRARPPPRISIEEEREEYIPNVPESFYDLRSAGDRSTMPISQARQPSADGITSYLGYPLLSRQQSYQASSHNQPPINFGRVTPNQISNEYFNQGYLGCTPVEWSDEDEHPNQHPLSSAAAKPDYPDKKESDDNEIVETKGACVNNNELIKMIHSDQSY